MPWLAAAIKILLGVRWWNLVVVHLAGNLDAAPSGTLKPGREPAAPKASASFGHRPCAKLEYSTCTLGLEHRFLTFGTPMREVPVSAMAVQSPLSQRSTVSFLVEAKVDVSPGLSKTRILTR